MPFSPRPRRAFPRPELEKLKDQQRFPKRTGRKQPPSSEAASGSQDQWGFTQFPEMTQATQGTFPSSASLPPRPRYLPDLVMIISVPSSWNLSQSSLVSRLQAILAISSLGMRGVVGISGSVHSEEDGGLLPPPLPPNSP